MAGDPVISVRGLRRRYGSLEAVAGVDLEVARGEVLAFLGPNGAGKTTTVEILEGFRHRDAGEVSVLGEDPARAPRGWRARIGVVLQQTEIPATLNAREALLLFAGYFPKPRDVEETLALVGLTEHAGKRAGRLSGGQQRRLDVALALIGGPDLLFLDEPTTGFDPAARREMWDALAGLRELGTTVLLTTHYLEEAERLADRVAIIAAGRIVAEGTPAALRAGAGNAARISFRLPAGVSAQELPVTAAPAPGGALQLTTQDPVAELARLCGWAQQRGIDLPGLEVTRPSLEDVYLARTGAAPE